MKNYITYGRLALLVSILPLQGGFLKSVSSTAYDLAKRHPAVSGCGLLTAAVACNAACRRIHIRRQEHNERLIWSWLDNTMRDCPTASDSHAVDDSHNDLVAAWQEYKKLYGILPRCVLYKSNIDNVKLCTSDYSIPFRCVVQQDTNTVQRRKKIFDRIGCGFLCSYLFCPSYLYDPNKFYQQCLNESLIAQAKSKKDANWLCTKQQELAQLKEAGEKLKAPEFAHMWLTNFSSIKDRSGWIRRSPFFKIQGVLRRCMRHFLER